MLTSKEKEILGHLPNWRYERRPQGIKVISLPVDTLLALWEAPRKRERLANLIAFDGEPPIYFEILGRFPKSSPPNPLGSIFDDLKESIGEPLNRSKVVVGYPFRSKETTGPWSHSYQHLSLWLLDTIDIDAIDDHLQASFGHQHELVTSAADVLCQVQASPAGTRHLAACVAGLLNAGIVHFSITIDPHQDWDMEDFSVMESQWQRVLTMAQEKRSLTPVTIAECRRIQKDDEYFCQPGLKRVFIDPKGKLWPCRQFYEMNKSNSPGIGNLNQGILESENQPFITFDPQAMQDCDECSWNLSCQNKCLWSNYRQSGTFYRTSGAVCAYEKAIRKAMESIPFTTESDSEWDDYLELICPHQKSA
jgi:radical SAM protein with 4Fe4S-binding SPASM domain